MGKDNSIQGCYEAIDVKQMPINVPSTSELEIF